MDKMFPGKPSISSFWYYNTTEEKAAPLGRIPGGPRHYHPTRGEPTGPADALEAATSYTIEFRIVITAMPFENSLVLNHEIRAK